MRFLTASVALKVLPTRERKGPRARFQATNEREGLTQTSSGPRKILASALAQRGESLSGQRRLAPLIRRDIPIGVDRRRIDSAVRST